MRRMWFALAAAAVLIGGAVAQAQQPESPDEVEAVVVTARRIGVPVWRVGDNLILVGHIQSVPKGTEWRPEELGRAVAQADQVIFPHAETASPADIARVLWRARSIVLLPKGETLSKYVDQPTLARIESFRAKGVVNDSYMKFHPWSAADDLLDSVGAEKNEGPDLADVMRREVRRRKKKHQVVGSLAAKTQLDAFFSEGPAAHVPCLQASLEAAEAGSGSAARRIEDYVRYRVAAVVRSPVERALGACFLTGAVESTTAKLRAEWRAGLKGKADGPGVTLAVVPLRFLAEENGLLDTFAAEGRQVDGPRWREDQP